MCPSSPASVSVLDDNYRDGGHNLTVMFKNVPAFSCKADSALLAAYRK